MYNIYIVYLYNIFKKNIYIYMHIFILFRIYIYIHVCPSMAISSVAKVRDEWRRATPQELQHARRAAAGAVDPSDGFKGPKGEVNP